MFTLNQYPHLKPDINGGLLIENISYRDIVEEFGTPVYIYSSRRIRENCETIRRVFDTAFRNKIFYSYKTNANPQICRIIHENGIGAEVISGSELEAAVRNKVEPDMIIFDGPYKPLNTVRKAVEYGVRLINADSLDELKLIDSVAGEMGVMQKVGLTLNPDSDSKIGIDLDTSVKKLGEYVKKLVNIKLSALHCHIRTQNSNLDSYLETLKHMSELSKKISAETGCEISVFDLGGGLPEAAIIGKKINYLSTCIREHEQYLDECDELYFEPGRFIVGDSAVLLTKILNIKNIRDRKWIIVDAGSNIISPLSKANYRFTIANRLLDDYSEKYSIGGPLPASFDVLNRSYCLPERIDVGDYVAILNAGAYCSSFAIRFEERNSTSILVEDGGVTRI